MRTRKRFAHLPSFTESVLEPVTAQPSATIHCDLDCNLIVLRAKFSNCADVVFHELNIFRDIAAMLIFVDGLVDKTIIESDIMPALLRSNENALVCLDIPLVDTITERLLTVSTAQTVTKLDKVINFIVEGQALLLINGQCQAIAMSAGGTEHRGIEEPITEGTIRGPHEGFNENVWTSTALIRRKIRTPDLKFEAHQIGKYTKTQVVLGYIDGLIKPTIADEVRLRLKRIDIDGVLESGYIEELIEDHPYSPFPQIQNTERPDVVAAMLLEGRFVILTDGTPFALVAPINLWGALQSSEDYYERYWVATLVRFLRYLFIWIALALPATYVAIMTYHPELLPTNLLLSVAAARESIPFPAVIEAFMMEVVFEALREAGIRLPKTVGNAISIVGALVIGQAAVQAGLVSAPMVIVVSITGIASFTIPRYNFALSIRMLRFPLLILAGTLGFFGILIGILAIVIHVCSLRSIGVSYTQPIAPLNLSGLKDTLIRSPWWRMKNRPAETTTANIQRETNRTRPSHRKPTRSRSKV